MKVMMVTHVDDLLYTCKPGYEHVVQKVLDFFAVNMKKVGEGSFRFCGREIVQDDQFNIRVTCRDTTEKILPVNFKTNGRKRDSAATPGEIGQLQSVVG